jgi:hypothetical protein
MMKYSRATALKLDRSLMEEANQLEPAPTR